MGCHSAVAHTFTASPLKESSMSSRWHWSVSDPDDVFQKVSVGTAWFLEPNGAKGVVRDDLIHIQAHSGGSCKTSARTSVTGLEIMPDSGFVTDDDMFTNSILTPDSEVVADIDVAAPTVIAESGATIGNAKTLRASLSVPSGIQLAGVINARNPNSMEMSGVVQKMEVPACKGTTATNNEAIGNMKVTKDANTERPGSIDTWWRTEKKSTLVKSSVAMSVAAADAAQDLSAQISCMHQTLERFPKSFLPFGGQNKEVERHVEGLAQELDRAQSQALAVLDLSLRNAAVAERLREVLLRQSMELCLETNRLATTRDAFNAFCAGVKASRAKETVDARLEDNFFEGLHLEVEEKNESAPARERSIAERSRSEASFFDHNALGSQIQWNALSSPLMTPLPLELPKPCPSNLRSSRRRITEKRMSGLVVQWTDKFGWIQPDQQIDHPLAKKHCGKIYVTTADVILCKIMEPGTRCSFHIYSDYDYLGAEECHSARDSSGRQSYPQRRRRHDNSINLSMVDRLSIPSEWPLWTPSSFSARGPSANANWCSSPVKVTRRRGGRGSGAQTFSGYPSAR